MISHENFIGEYSNIFDKEYCDKVIDYFNFQRECQHTFGRAKNRGTLMEDEGALINACNMVEVKAKREENSDLINIFNSIFWEQCYSHYAEKYNILNNLEQHTIRTFKIQKTSPTQGYHVWHCENGEESHSTRLLAYTLYLNDVEEGGETEFLYQSKRCKPEMGKILLFPAYFTHTHRGNPPLSNDKYIITGWIEFT